jgi:hypothetical protein
MIYNANLISVHFVHFVLKDTLKDKDFSGQNTIVFRVIMDSNLIQLGYIYKTIYILTTYESLIHLDYGPNGLDRMDRIGTQLSGYKSK